MQDERDPRKGADRNADRNVKPNQDVNKDPEDWVTGDETMTAAQASYLRTLCEEAGEPFDPNLTKAEASRRIDELRRRTGRGIDH